MPAHAPTPCPFRLFSIDGRDSRGVFTLTVVEDHDSHSVNYQAISYAWLGQDRDTAIECNGVQQLITVSLQEFLTTLYDQQSGPPSPDRTWYWVDQICILQNRSDDKERQVPLMDTYFSQAEEVLIWLGASNNSTDLTLHLAEDVIMKLADTKAVEHLWVDLRQLPDDFLGSEHIFWRGLGDILMRPWFNRLWVLQELLLAKKTKFYCGHSASDISTLMERLTQTELLELAHAPGLDFQGRVRLPHALYAFRYYDTGVLPVDVLIGIAVRRQCTQSIDKVYATLGLMPPEERALVKVNYSTEDADSHIDTWILWSHLALKATDLRWLLRIELSRDRRLPSWCPNLSSTVEIDPFADLLKRGDAAAYNAGGHDIFLYAVTANKRGLICSGWIVDKVNDVVGRSDLQDAGVQSQLPQDQSHSDWPDFGEAMKDENTSLASFISRSWTLAQDAVGNSDDKWTTFLRTMTGNSNIGPGKSFDSPQDDDALKQNWATFKEHGSFYKFGTVPEAAEDYVRIALRKTCQGRNFFLTKGGMMGLGPLDIQVGDLVCALHRIPICLIAREVDPKTNVDLVQMASDRDNIGCTLVGPAYASIPCLRKAVPFLTSSLLLLPSITIHANKEPQLPHAAIGQAGNKLTLLEDDKRFFTIF